MEGSRTKRLVAAGRQAVEWAATTAWRPVVVARAAFQRDRDIGGGLIAGALAFRLFVWSAAFAVVLVAVLGFIDAAGQDANDPLDSLGVTAFTADQVSQAASDADRGRWVLLVVGLYALFSTSRSMVRALWVSNSLAWGLPITRPPTIKGILAYNGLVAALVATMLGAGKLRAATPGPGLVFTLAAVAGFLLAAGLALHWLPNPDLPVRDLLPGAVLLAVGLQAMHLIASLYIPGRVERASETYGALGIAIVLLLWLYLYGRLIVAGSVLNATLWNLREESQA
jgi:uncharacterized BrkB/YihY/UPF0761 family membrane protein